MQRLNAGRVISMFVAMGDWLGLASGQFTMMSSNGNIFRVTGHLCGEFPSQRPFMRSLDVFFDLRLNKRLSKQSRRRWLETLSGSLWRHCNDSNAWLIGLGVWLIYRFRWEPTRASPINHCCYYRSHQLERIPLNQMPHIYSSYKHAYLG